MTDGTRELLRFGAVGLFHNGVNLGVFAVLLALGTPYPVCAVAGAGAALGVSFVLNRTFTFTEHEGAAGEQLWRYAIVFVASILAGVAVLTLGVELAGLPEVPAQAIAIVVVAPCSYLAQKRWSFKTRVPVA